MVSIRKILVVDDEPAIRMLLAEVLTRSAFSVVTATDGLDAVLRLRRSRFDAVVTDIDMPGMDGIELLRWMKKNRRKETVVVITGKPDCETLSGPGLPHVAARFRKPFRLPDFLRTMDSLFHEKGRTRNVRSKAKRKVVA